MKQDTRPYGFCDRTGFRYPLEDLVEEVVDGVLTGNRVGKDMEDHDHPQLHLDDLPELDDPRSLENPRPDQSLTESRKLFSWNPAGGNMLPMRASVGRVTVETS